MEEAWGGACDEKAWANVRWVDVPEGTVRGDDLCLACLDALIRGGRRGEIRLVSAIPILRTWPVDEGDEDDGEEKRHPVRFVSVVDPNGITPEQRAEWRRQLRERGCVVLPGHVDVVHIDVRYPWGLVNDGSEER